MINRFLNWATTQRWAVVVSIVASIPALVLYVQELVDGNGGKWSVTLIPAIAGFIIQRKVWSQRSVDALQAGK